MRESATGIVIWVRWISIGDDYMDIKTYMANIICFYLGLLLLFVLAGIIILILSVIRKKAIKCWWIIPYSILYLIYALLSAAIAGIAYDDIADPNYWRYEGWKLHDFVLNDVRKIAIWLLLGALLYFVFERKETNKVIKTGGKVLLIILAILTVVMIALSIVVSL